MITHMTNHMITHMITHMTNHMITHMTNHMTTYMTNHMTTHMITHMTNHMTTHTHNKPLYVLLCHSLFTEVMNFSYSSVSISLASVLYFALSSLGKHDVHTQEIGSIVRGNTFLPW